MANVIALVPADMEKTRLGLGSKLCNVVAGRTVLEHTLRRLGRVKSIKQIVLVHPAGQEPLSLLEDIGVIGKDVKCYADEDGLTDPLHSMRTSSRKWALGAWRGGLGGMTCYDELLPAGPLVGAMREFDADSGLLVGGDWMLVDPGYCQSVLELHLKYPQEMAFTFTQAPPGLGGVAIGRGMVEELDKQRGLIGTALGYQPAHAQGDPIGRDVCVQIDGLVRNCGRRFIYDTNRSGEMIDAVAGELGKGFCDASAEQVVEVVGALEGKMGGGAGVWGALPQQVTMELTGERSVDGAITPQHYVKIDRGEMGVEQAKKVIDQVALVDDGVITFGGLGDAMLHPQWQEIVKMANEAGVFGIAVQTDLLGGEEELQGLMDLGVDAVCAHINADSAKVYEKVMGVGGERGFEKVQENIIWLLERRRERMSAAIDGIGDGQVAWPWIVPHLTKTVDTLVDMERFFDRWVHFANQAVILGSQTGRGNGGALMQELSPVRMCPPRRVGCRQLDRRMTVHSDGKVALCDQDWLGDGCVGDVEGESLCDIWKKVRVVGSNHGEGRYEGICSGCHEWHRP